MSTLLPTSADSRAAVLLAMVQALSVKQGYDSLGSESDRRRLAEMGPEERFKALQIEFVALTYRLETREMELRGTRARLEEVENDFAALKRLHSVQSRREFEEEIIAKYTNSHAQEALDLHSILEQDRQKLKNAIDADLVQHIPKPKAVTLDELLQAAGVKPKDTSTRSRLHNLLAEFRAKHFLYPSDDTEDMVRAIKAFVKGCPGEFDVAVVHKTTPLLPWDATAGGKRKHPVDKAWDAALDTLERCRVKRTGP
jgi:hypothetical protein